MHINSHTLTSFHICEIVISHENKLKIKNLEFHKNQEEISKSSHDFSIQMRMLLTLFFTIPFFIFFPFLIKVIYTSSSEFFFSFCVLWSIFLLRNLNSSNGISGLDLQVTQICLGPPKLIARQPAGVSSRAPAKINGITLIYSHWRIGAMSYTK